MMSEADVWFIVKQVRHLSDRQFKHLDSVMCNEYKRRGFDREK